MSLKPTIMRDVLVDAPTLTKVLGPKLGKQFTANPNVTRYAFVLKFPEGVATGRSVAHALRKIGTPRGSTLIAGDRFTIEAREVAAAEGCDLVSSESANAFLWTDADYAKAREPFSSRSR